MMVTEQAQTQTKREGCDDDCEGCTQVRRLLTELLLC